MTETNKLKVNKLKNEVPTNQQQQKVDKKLITLKGYTTSQINQALKADNPYPARVFLKIDNQEQDIPIFFRIKAGDNWIRPKIKIGSYLQVEGYFANSDKERQSFTATSYQLLACPHSQKKPYFCPIDCPCLKGKEVLNQQLNQQILASHE